jgi:hypothetical protein
MPPPFPADRFLENVLWSTVTMPPPSFEMAAPWRPPPAWLSENCDSVTAMVPIASSSALFAIAPAPTRDSSRPTTAAELSATVLFVTVTVPSRLLLTALPLSNAALRVNDESRTCTVPPTWLSIPPPVFPATLPVTVDAVIVTVPVLLLRMAPPYSAAYPSRRVRPDRSSAPSSTSTSKRRSSPGRSGGAPAGGGPPSMMVEPAPAPVIVRLSVTSRSPVVMMLSLRGGMVIS